ncbi:hypothetical protein JCM10212_001824 [Sporobolomyces blumeae]
MERWTALLPDRAPSNTGLPLHPRPRRIGRLTEETYLVVLQFLPVPDLPQFALASKRFSQLVRHDRVWKTKLNWLDYKGPGEFDWTRNDDDDDDDDDEGEASTGRYRDDPEPVPEPSSTTGRNGRSQAVSSDDEFGDFFDGHDDAGQGDLDGTDDGFGDFQDGDVDTSTDVFGLSDEFASGSRTARAATISKPKPKPSDDLLLMFDDDDDEAAGTAFSTRALASSIAASTATTKPRRPPAVSNLTFDTTPTLPTPPLTARPSAFAFNPSTPTAASPTAATTKTKNYLDVFKKFHSTLIPYYVSLMTHTTSSLVFTTSTLTPMVRARLLSTLGRFCHPLVAPTRSLPQRMTVLRNVQSATDFFESALLSEFEKADTTHDEDGMKDKAKVLWQLNESSSLAQIFVQKREIFYDQSHDPLKNLTKIETPSGGLADGIDFSAMDACMQSILSVLAREGSLIARVFPPEADVLLYFLERIANDVVADYITTLLSAAQGLQHPLFLLATAATFGQVYRLVDAVLEIEPKSRLVTKERAEDVVFKMFEPLMDDYLSEEGEWIREVLVGMCDEWDQKTASDLAISDPTFLASQNPAQVKKNVLAGFTKVLLLPVTIIPKTASYGLNAITYGATGAFNTFASIGTQLGGPWTRSST